MIVTCESCKSRYKLDDSKITGRGAKITCPRCKFVFVVHARSQNEPATPRPPDLVEAVRAASVTAPKPAAAAWEEDEPTRIGLLPPPAGTTVKAPPVPEEPSHEVVRADFSTEERARLNTEERARLSATRPLGEMAARAAALDFRKVGVTTWKVKVKIGLIYDFSDIRTLRKYIQDGRVTAADVISWDGKNWKPIGEIPDLDEFFVETWERLAASRVDSMPEAPKDGPVKTPSDPPKGPTMNEPIAFADPFEETKRRQRSQNQGAPRRSNTTTMAITPTRRPAQMSPRTRKIVLAVILLCGLVAGSALWLANQPDGPAVAGGSIATPKPPPAADTQSFQDKLNRELEEALRAHPAPVEAKDPKELVPIVPAEVREGVPIGARPVVPRTLPTASAQDRDQTAQDHVDAGDSAMRSRNFSVAVAAYQRAAGMDPKNPVIQEKLGLARYEAGDLEGAAPSLQKAAQAGYSGAYKVLGHIARRQGDIAGAKGHYMEYLKASPRDAADIQRAINEMSGG